MSIITNKDNIVFLRIAIVVLLVVSILLIPTFVDLYVIWTTKKHYLIDKMAASIRETQSNTSHTEVPAAIYLNDLRPLAWIEPEYGISEEDCRDNRGWVDPENLKGRHWKLWGLKTKTVAILMWQWESKKQAASPWEIRTTAICVNDYFERNNADSEALRHVVMACNGW
jgi:hypothetical protein